MDHSQRFVPWHCVKTVSGFRMTIWMNEVCWSSFRASDRRRACCDTYRISDTPDHQRQAPEVYFNTPRLGEQFPKKNDQRITQKSPDRGTAEKTHAVINSTDT